MGVVLLFSLFTFYGTLSAASTPEKTATQTELRVTDQQQGRHTSYRKFLYGLYTVSSPNFIVADRTPELFYYNRETEVKFLNNHHLFNFKIRPRILFLTGTCHHSDIKIPDLYSATTHISIAI